MRITRLSALAFAALLVAAAAHAAVQDTVRRTFNVADGGTLTLEADAGDVRITSGGSGVTVEIARKARESDVLREHELTFDQQGNDVRIRSKFRGRDFGWFRRTNPLELRYTIRVPSRYNLNVRTSGGDLDVRDIAGSVDCRTSGGDLRLGRINGPVIAVTSGGSVEIEEAGGTLEAKTSGGSIDVRHASANVLARTSGGSIEIRGAAGAIDAVTSGGSITAAFEKQPAVDSRLSTSGGGVTVTLAPSVAVDLDAHTSGGGITADVPVTVSGTQSESSLVGKINGGGPRLVVRTSGGGIRLSSS
ncbi:MAG: DUF4097 family beta strand repeat-containing protein [Thermoanaerobaculia bacterium]